MMDDPIKGELGIVGHYAKFDADGNLLDIQFGRFVSREIQARVRNFYSQPPSERRGTMFPDKKALEPEPLPPTAVHTIELSEVDYEALSFVLGYATGAAMRDDNRRLANLCTHLANAVNKNNPNWIPYQEEAK